MGNAEGKLANSSSNSGEGGGVKLMRRARGGQGGLEVEEIGGGGAAVVAGEICEKNPGHYVCHADQLILLEQELAGGGGGAGPRRLGPQEELQPGRVYALLPCSSAAATLLDPAEISAFLALAAQAKLQSSSSPNPSAAAAAAASFPDLLLLDCEHLDSPPPPLLSPRDVTLLLAHDLGGSPPSPDLLHSVLADAQLEIDQCCSPRSNMAVVPHVVTPELMRRDPDIHSALTKHIVTRSCSRHWKPPLATIHESSSSSSSSSSSMST